MIFVSSSGDHFDCFLAGECEAKSWLDDSRFAGTAERAVVGTGATLVATLDCADSDWETDAGELMERRSSSSVDLSNDEISTMNESTGTVINRSVEQSLGRVSLCSHAHEDDGRRGREVRDWFVEQDMRAKP